MKEGALHREWSIWNKMILDQQKAFTQSTIYESDDDDDDDEISEKSTIAKLTQDSPYQYQKDTRKSKKSIKIAALIFLFYTIMWWIDKVPLKHHNCMTTKNAENEFSFRNLNVQETLEDNSKPHEVFEIPLSPYKDISSPVYSQHLLEHPFGLSWSKPILLEYTPPPSNISYDRVVLTLDTTIDGVQYDRLVHIYLEDTEVWRSSTIEPSGKLSHSFAQKDVTLYYDLFSRKGEMLVQLDNLVTGKLTGVFHIKLSVLYFKDDIKGPDRYGRTPSHPKIVPLTSSKYGKADPPIVYYPDSSLSLSLPHSPHNVTNLLLLLTTSANAAEEFWYSNLLDQYRKAFVDHGRHFYGHGSCRVINVYANGVRVHSANPKPYIYTGGIAPTFWNTIVSTGAFDISPYLIDLTPILPLMWDESINLEVDVSNCLDDDEKRTEKSGIGSNWITSASLALFEDEEIDFSFGQIESITNSTNIKSFAVKPPFTGFLTQIIKGSYSNVFQTNVTHIYKNGSQITELSTFENYVTNTAVNLISKWGNAQSILSLPKLNTTVTILNADTLSPIKEVTKLANSSIINKIHFLPQEGSKDISFSTNLTVGVDVGAYVRDSPIFVIHSKENGTADFTIVETGSNFGSATIQHNYTLTDLRGNVYNRIALAENSTLVYDKVTETNCQNIQSEDTSVNSASLFGIIGLDWLSSEEMNELESFLTTEELAELIDHLLDFAF